jgi:hypothetical protein
MGLAKKVLEYVGKKASNYSKKKDKISFEPSSKIELKQRKIFDPVTKQFKTIGVTPSNKEIN